MLYQFLKIWVGLAAKIFCRKIIINYSENLKKEGPLLLAANHPNSFLDAMILDILFQKPVWSLTRGDMFKKPIYIRLLNRLKMLPVYRTSEGVENLDINYKTFDACKELFKRKGVVLMFSEGKCINEWHLRPLKKGTARLAISSWQNDIDVKVLPVGINYSSFRRFGKNMIINFGAVITQHDIDMNDTEGKKYFAFNNKLQHELQQLVFEIPHGNKPLQEKLLVVKPGTGLKVLLFLPALAGLIINAPLYLPVRYFTKSKAGNSDHYDSIIISLLTFLYPLYVFLITSLLVFITCSWASLSALLLLPFTAWAYVQLKGQLDKVS